MRGILRRLVSPVSAGKIPAEAPAAQPVAQLKADFAEADAVFVASVQDLVTLAQERGDHVLLEKLRRMSVALSRVLDASAAAVAAQSSRARSRAWRSTHTSGGDAGMPRFQQVQEDPMERAIQSRDRATARGGIEDLASARCSCGAPAVEITRRRGVVVAARCAGHQERREKSHTDRMLELDRVLWEAR